MHGSGPKGTVNDNGIARSVEQRAIGAEGLVVDSDRTASERDEADAMSDHLAAERDRTSTTRLRADSAAGREATATRRDATARLRDVQAETLDRTIAASDAPLAEKLEEIRARAVADRARAADDRDQAAVDRAHAADERFRLESELDSAHLDDLTGAFRRETGSVALRLEIDRARRADGRFVIAYVDVDGMKRVNDRDGHAAGDNVLKTLVWTMRSNLRSFDPVVRYGGDEFVCGLGGVDLEEVERRFEVIDRLVQRDVGVGISVGLAGLEPDDTLERLTARADAALLEVRKRRAR